MIKLRTPKVRPILQVQTSIAPEIANEIRWDSTFKMLDKYLDLHDDLSNCNFDKETKKFIPSKREHMRISELHGNLSQFRKVSLYLQQEDPEKVSMYNLRALFDDLMRKYPDTEKHLATNSDIVQNQNFENAIVKIQAHREFDLTNAEKEAVEFFLVDSQDENEYSESDNEDLGSIERVLKDAAVVNIIIWLKADTGRVG